MSVGLNFIDAFIIESNIKLDLLFFTIEIRFTMMSGDANNNNNKIKTAYVVTPVGNLQ